MKQNKIPRNEYIRKPVGKTDPYKDDVVYGKLGQYTAPGQVTRIPGDAYGTPITMTGVPYPVYGEDNLGYSQMMYPGMDYQFPGQYVTEYPQHKVFETEEDFNKDRLLEIRSKYWPTRNTRPFDTGFDIPNSRTGPGPVRMPSITSDYKGVAMMYGGILMAQKGKQVEDRDSWLENIAEIIDPTGISSWDDVYRAYKNTGLSGETVLEALGAIPLLGKIGKSGKVIAGGFGLLQDAVKASKYLPTSKQQKFIDKAFNTYQKYNKAGGKELDEALGSTTKILKDKIPYINPTKWSSSDKAINVANKAFKTGRISDAVQAALGSKDNSGFTWDMRHGEVPMYNGRNIFPQIQLGEHGDFAYGGDPSLPDITGHYQAGGWLDEYQSGGEKPWGEMTPKERAAYLDKKDALKKQHKKADAQAKQAEAKSREQAKKEYYKDWVAENYDQGAMNPLFQTVASFTPLGTIPFAMQSGVNAINNLAQGNYLDAGIDAAFANPLFKGLKGAKKVIPKAKSTVNQSTKSIKNKVIYPSKPVEELSEDLQPYLYRDVVDSKKVYYDPKGNIIEPSSGFNPWGVRENIGDVKLINEDISFDPWNPSMTYYGKPVMKFSNESYRTFQEEGGETEDNTFRKGGLFTPPKLKRKVKKQGTSKNIATSVNKLFTRNYDVFGPSGKNIYNPNVYKTGGQSTGWLDNLD